MRERPTQHLVETLVVVRLEAPVARCLTVGVVQVVNCLSRNQVKVLGHSIEVACAPQTSIDKRE